MYGNMVHPHLPTHERFLDIAQEGNNYPHPANLIDLNFQPLEVVSRYSYLFNLRPNINKY